MPEKHHTWFRMARGWKYPMEKLHVGQQLLAKSKTAGFM